MFGVPVEGVRSELNVDPDRWNPDGSAVLVVSGIGNVLEIEGGKEAREYLVAIVGPGHVMYSSDSGFGDPEPADADGRIDIFGRVQDQLGSPVHVFHMPSACALKLQAESIPRCNRWN
jgi:hypothetical protein